MELLVDGVQVDAEAAPTSQGLSPFLGDLSFLAEDTGPYSLLVRAHDTQGRSGEAVVSIQVLQPQDAVDGLEQLAAQADDAAQPVVHVPQNYGGGGPGPVSGEGEPPPLPEPDPSPQQPPDGGDNGSAGPSSGPGYEILLSSIFPALEGGQVYCYYTLDGVNWARYPADPNAFVTPAENGAGKSLISLAEIVDGMILQTECWGWQDGQLQYLGKQDYGGIGPGGSSGGTGPDISIQAADDFDFDIDFLVSYRIPKVLAWAAFSGTACVEHSGVNVIAAGLICSAFPEDQAYTVWGPIGGCPAKDTSPSAQCFTEQDIIGYRVYDTLFSSTNPTATTGNQGQTTVYALQDWGACASRQVSVSALVQTDDGIQEGLRSNQVFYNGHPECPFQQGQIPKTVHFTWTTIQMSDVDDGVADNTVEAYGYLKISLDGNTYLRGLSSTSEQCHSQPCGLAPYTGEPFDFSNGTYNWSGIPLCATTQQSCSYFWDVNNNVVDIPVWVNSGNMKVTIKIWDHDGGSGDDAVCIVSAWVDPLNLGNHSLFDNGNDADCVISWTMQE
jgi:hypothetical protein